MVTPDVGVEGTWRTPWGVSLRVGCAGFCLSGTSKKRHRPIFPKKKLKFLKF
jgi:hypothetical protein